MIKRIIFGLLAVPGLLVIILVAVSKRLLGDFNDNRNIDFVIDYMIESDGVSGLIGLDFEIGMLLILHKANEYSHLLITLGVIWVIIFAFLMINSGRSKVDKSK